MSLQSHTRSRTEGPLITGVLDGSPAAQAGARVGDEITAVDGVMPRDIIEWQWAIDVSNPNISVTRGGLERELEIVKPEGASIGIEIESAVFDRVRTCDNHCEFCFIHQLPKGMRRSLYLKDD
ncbi:MAG: PDZ domain-containing protein, partial [Actinomycetota bacterium]|nr:PDZ domain-containing protein [Actinomycetota bacterium]